MRIEVLVEKAEGNWAASSTDKALGGNFVAATADTREAAIAKFRESLYAYFDYVRTFGKQVPQVTEFDVHELISA